jgi:hypothetical protein
MVKKKKKNKSQETIVRVKRKSSDDPLECQISIQVKRPKGVKISKKVLQQAIDYKLKDEKFRDPRGFKLRIVSWTNPTRPHTVTNPRNGLPLNAPRSYGPDKERWLTLRGALLSARMGTRKVRITK